jgi:poly(A) polymerase
MRRFLAETPQEDVRPTRVLTGDDLIGLGFRPGPEFREILDAAEDAQLEGNIETRDDALAWLRKYRQAP